MNVVHLRYARAVAREGSFGRAAKACSVTQPALSNGIAVLERRLGGRLFDRGPQGVVPTALGERLLPMIDGLLRGVDALFAEARLATEEPRPLRLGVSPAVGPKIVGRLFDAFSVREPGRRIILRAAGLAELGQALDDAELDLVVAPVVPAGPWGRHALAPVAREPLVLVPVAGAPAAEGAVELTDLAGTTLLLPGDACGLAPFTRALLAEHDVSVVEYPGRASDCRVLQDWAGLGLGSVLLPASKVVDGAGARPVLVGGVPVTVPYEARWIAASPAAPTVRAVL